MRLLWLADVLRSAGLKVHEYPDWRKRGSESWGPLRGIVCHATAGSRTSTDAGETRVLWVTGSSSAPAPISQLYLSRSGEWWVGASGRCNHVLVGDKGPHKGFGNYQLIGIEAANDNRGEPWPSAQVTSYAVGVAAICRRMGWSADRVVGHREHQSGKSDPLGIDMAAFRSVVAGLIKGDKIGMAMREDGDFLYLVYRMYSLVHLLPQTPIPGGKPEPNLAAAALVEMRDTLRELKGRSPAQPTSVDPAALAAAVRQALSDPAVLSAVAKAVNDDHHRRMEK